MSARDEEWGPWVEHDGTGFPEKLRGVFIEVVGIAFDGVEQRAIGKMSHGFCERAWDWSFYGQPDLRFGWRNSKIIRYRIRKPKAMTILRACLEVVSTPVDEVVS